MPDRTHAPMAAEDDDIVQASVMTQVLILHPAQLTMDELMHEMNGSADDFASRDQINCAVRDLIRSGLLHRNGDFLIPTRPAVRFNELPDAGT